MDVPQLTKTDEIATGANGKRARDEPAAAAAAFMTELGKLRIASAQRGTRERPRYVELEFDRNEAQRALATVRFPEAELARFRVSEQERKNSSGAAYKARDFIAPWTRDEIGTRTKFGEFVSGVAELFVEKCTVGGRTPVDLVVARYPALAGVLPEWDVMAVGLSRFMRATKSAMSVWRQGTYGKGDAEMQEQDPFAQAQPVATSETPGEEGVFMVPVFSGGKFAQRKATMKMLEAVVVGVKYSDLDGGGDGTKSPAVWLTPIVTKMHFELM